MTTQFVKPLNIVCFLGQAILDYYKETQHHPTQIELHPNLFADFKKEVSPNYAIFDKEGDLIWHRVKIVQVWDAQYPRMIGHKGDVVFL